MEIGNIINWVISGLIGLVFGIFGSIISHQLQSKRDKKNWERKIEETRNQLIREENIKIRENLLKGIDDPINTINGLGDTLRLLRNESNNHHLIENNRSSAIPIIENIIEIIKDTNPEL